MGKVYVLTNDYMPELVKIGQTTQELSERLKSLDSTGVPWPFRCHFAIETERYKEIELLLHSTFSWCRLRENREFFKVSPECVVAALRISGEKEIIVPNDAVDENGKTLQINTNKGRFSFEQCKIPMGAELLFIRNPEKKCKVVSNGLVEFEGEYYSLTKLALRFLNEMGYNWKFARGPQYFSYEGKALSDIQEEMVEDE